ncbi:MAG: diaminopimelate epimerase [Bacteroidia bacterium]|nr:diaminopimelate epimerase [Bacteroidia bacterium]
MERKIEFTKMHGLGNDYIYIDADRFPIADPSAFSIKWSKPHTGIGSDGLILISKSDIADYRMRIFNADGSEALMCGNGSRCVAKYVYDKKIASNKDTETMDSKSISKASIALETNAGIKNIDIDVKGGVAVAATVDMGEPILNNTAQVNTDDGSLNGQSIVVEEHPFHPTFVCMGNPHCVIFVDDVSRVPVEILGPQIEFNPIFPERTNVEFVQVLSDGSLRMRVWERGSGITQACGTGACATAVAAFLTDRAGRQSTVRMDGGDLQITWSEADNHIYMHGPAETSFEGYILES